MKGDFLHVLLSVKVDAKSAFTSTNYLILLRFTRTMNIITSYDSITHQNSNEHAMNGSNSLVWCKNDTVLVMQKIITKKKLPIHIQYNSIDVCRLKSLRFEVYVEKFAFKD